MCCMFVYLYHVYQISDALKREGRTFPLIDRSLEYIGLCYIAR